MINVRELIFSVLAEAIKQTKISEQCLLFSSVGRVIENNFVHEENPRSIKYLVYIMHQAILKH
jgi:hypothetical protein